MKEKIQLELLGRKPEFAKGHVRLDLFDPITLKVKDRIEGDNHVFSESMLAGYSGKWVNRISSAFMVLGDSPYAIDTQVPYILGQAVGYGVPNQGTLGTFRGAYNAANQILAQKSIDKIRWKFQYDFTTAQANGAPITQIGLTNQFSSGAALSMLSGYDIPSNSNDHSKTQDGRYAYSISSAGIITVTDLWVVGPKTIDISLVVGNLSADTKGIAYSPSDGKFMVIKYNSTAANRRCYVFSDSTFSTLLNTYTTSNNNVAYYEPGFFCGNYLYGFGSSTIYKVDFVNNLAPVAINVGDTSGLFSNITTTEQTYLATKRLGGFGVVPINDKLIAYSFCRFDSNSGTKSIIFDIEQGMVAGYATPITSSYVAACLYPLTAEKLVCPTDGNCYTHGAITTYQLPEPVTKTSAYGMTATYELEVYW